MADYNVLKASIQDVIKQNGNNEITGALLQQSLLAIINSLGANFQFSGIATPLTDPGTPDQNVFYLAFVPGIYTGFGNINVSKGINVLTYNGSWALSQLIKIDDQPTPGSGSLVLGNGVFSLITDGIYDKVFITRKNIFNRDLSTVGQYINSSGQIAYSDSFETSGIIPVESNTTYHLSANGDIVVGNANSFGWFYKTDGTKELFSTNSTTISVPENCYAIEFSYAAVRTFIQLEKGIERTEYESFISGKFSDLLEYFIPLKRFLLTASSNNLCGEYNKIDRTFVGWGGVLSENNDYKTYIIPVNGGQTYQFVPSGDEIYMEARVVCVFDDYGNVLSYLPNIQSIVTPDKSKWMLVSFRRDYYRCQTSKGAAAIPYVDGNRYISPKILYDFDAILPRQFFVLKGEQNSIYHSEYCRNYDDRSVYADKNGGIWNFNKRCWRVESTLSTGGNLSFVLRDRRTNEILNTISVTSRIGDKLNVATNKNINVIGDSFCFGGYYLKHIADMCGNVTFVGMRECERYDIPCEGRGGWTLAQYFDPKSPDIALTHLQPFSPFMHASGYNYYGVIEFWAAIVNNTSQYPYGSSGFDNYKSWFNTDGRKKNPVLNDMMYNQTAAKFEYWNGSSWTQLAQDPVFAFDYAKYVSVWQISSPDFVIFQLGTNDFYSGNADFEQWFAQMDAAIESINNYATLAGKTINILLCTVLTASGTPNNIYNDGVIKRNKYYYEARKRIIEKYDPAANQVNNHVYIVDTGVVVDDEFGFLTEERLPFAYYDGTARELYDYNGVHPSEAGYKQFANPIAAAIQFLR